ncbi:MAG: hypothetical protein IJ939_01115, partial [Clostridia bacterium]|nr:hypothetical protein [Clostridia bacterium]
SKGTTSDVKVNYVEPENEFDYYFDPVNFLYTDIPRADGSMEILGEKVYFFDAPYEYIRPDFSEDMSEFEKYHLMNANNLKLIDFKQLSDGTYCYYIDNTRPLSNADDLIVNLQRLFSNGIYYIEITDADGDGIYDYIQYMPATYGFMNGDTSVTFKEKMTGNEPIFEENEDADEYDITIVPTIYCNGADIEGEAVKDGDFVVAYLNPKANYMKIIEVVNPVTDTVYSYNKAQSKITFSENGDHYCLRGYRIVEGFSSGDSGLDQQYINRPFCYKHLFIVSVIFQDLFNVNIFNGDVTVYSVEAGGLKNILYYDAPAVVEQPEEPEIPEEPVVLEEPYNYRIISSYDIGNDEEGTWRFYYSIYDPFTGTRSDDIPSVKSADKAKYLGNALACGTVVKITNDFLIDDAESEVVGSVDFSNLVWIKSMDETSMTVVPVDETAECRTCVTTYMDNYTGTTYTDIFGVEMQSNVVAITQDTKFSVMNRSSLDENFFIDATIKDASVSDVIAKGKNLLCYNSRNEDRNGNYVTRYADYKKALVLPNANGDAVFVIVIVNGNDAAALNVACENCQ